MVRRILNTVKRRRRTQKKSGKSPIVRGIKETRHAGVKKVTRGQVIEELDRIIHTRSVKYTRLPTEVLIRRLTREGREVFKRIERKEASAQDLQQLKAEIQRIKEEAGAQE